MAPTDSPPEVASPIEESSPSSTEEISPSPTEEISPSPAEDISSPEETSLTEETPSSVVFYPFKHLPPELRRLIWIASLPEDDPQAVYFFGLRDKPITYEGNPEDYDESSFGYNVPFELFVPFQSSDPPAQLFVNREARAATFVWIDRMGLELRYREQTNSHVLTRNFNPRADILYIPTSKWEEWLTDPGLVSWRPSDNHYIVAHQVVWHIAVSADLLYTQPGPFINSLVYDISLRTVYVVFDAPPDLEPQEAWMTPPHRWEIKVPEDKEHDWSHYFWDEKEEEYYSEEGDARFPASVWMERAMLGLGFRSEELELTDDMTLLLEDIEIKPAIAVRK